MKEKVKLNLGCGANKIKGFINIDTEKSVKPDLKIDFINDGLPFNTKSVDEVVLFHTIEHIQKRLHRQIFDEISRVLKVDTKLYISYPEFWKCALNWKNNYQGQREFWENTIYGRQSYPSDFHVCIIDPHELSLLLQSCGFKHIQHTPELIEKHNTITVGTRSTKKYITYEQLLAQDKVKIRKIS